MTFDQIRYVVAIADHGSFRRAADSLDIAPASLSEQVRNLELALGLKVFTRSSRSVTLTAAGEDLVKQGRVLMKQMAAIQATMAQHRTGERGLVRLGMTPHATSLTLGNLLHSGGSGEVEVHITEGHSGRLLRLLREGLLDLSVLSWAEGDPPDSCDYVELETTPMGVVVDPGNAHAHCDRIPLREFADVPLVTFAEGSPVRQIAVEACARAGFEPTIIYDGEVLSEICRRVKAGLGFTILYQERAEEFGLRFIPCDPKPRDRILGLAWQGGAVLRAPTLAVQRSVIEIFGGSANLVSSS